MLRLVRSLCHFGVGFTFVHHGCDCRREIVSQWKFVSLFLIGNVLKLKFLG
jgi:hypothetical protein